MTLQWWDIYACPTLFLPRSFLFKKIYDFFFNFYFVPKWIYSLNISFMMKKSIIKTFEPSQNFSKFVPPSHWCDKPVRHILESVYNMPLVKYQYQPL